MTHHVLRPALSILVVLIVTSAGLAQPPRGYRVYGWGYYDLFPYPPPVGASVNYFDGPPSVAYVDPWGRVVDMPLRPKVLYGGTPFLTPDGYYYPTSIAVVPSRGPRPVSYKVAAPTSAPKRPAETIVPIPKARDLDLPDVPALPPLPKPPAIPGVHNLGPAPADSVPEKPK